MHTIGRNEIVVPAQADDEVIINHERSAKDFATLTHLIRLGISSFLFDRLVELHVLPKNSHAASLSLS